MRIALTGGRGGMGRAVVEQALARGDTVVSVDRAPADEPRDGVEQVVGDTSDYDLLVESFAGCDALVHMAALPTPFGRPDHVVHATNVVGSYNAMRAAVEVGIERVCQASSVNATGLSFNRAPRIRYLPLDEQHPTSNEDPYSLSKWLAEAQADSLARRYDRLGIASLRLHWVVDDRAAAVAAYHDTAPDTVANLWSYTVRAPAARACLMAVDAGFTGHEVLLVVAPDSVGPLPSDELAARFYPGVPVVGDLSGHAGFFDCSKAERVLGWRHDDPV